MNGTYIFLPVKIRDTGRIGYTRKAIADLDDNEKEYQQKLLALGPRPDMDLDGSNEYGDWVIKADAVTKEYVDKL